MRQWVKTLCDRKIQACFFELGIGNGLMGAERHGLVSLPLNKKRRVGMKNTMNGSFVAALCVAVLMGGVSAKAEEVAEVKKGEARFAIGLTYVSGMIDVGDYIEDMYESNGIEADVLVIPVGLTFVGGYRFAFGMEIMGDFGPVSLIMVDDTFADDLFMNIDVPVGLTAGYAFFADKSVSPYVRGGFRYHFSGGDFTESSSPGLYVAGGVNFFSNKAVQLQLEVAYDASKVTYQAPDFYGGGYEKEIEPGGLMISVRAAF